MGLDLQNQSAETIVQRINAIIRELEDLRQAVVAVQVSSPTADLAQELFGALGQGFWSEYELDLGRS